MSSVSDQQVLIQQHNIPSWHIVALLLYTAILILEWCDCGYCIVFKEKSRL